MYRINVLSALALVIFLIMCIGSYADPNGASIANISVERRTDLLDSTQGSPVEADAGNMTLLFINSTTLTQRWQGYYGNVSGVITLDDANLNTLYEWVLVDPTGEIYAVNGSASPTWSSVECLQFNRTVTTTDLTMLQTNLGMTVSDLDNVNNTFNLDFDGSFNIGGSNTINSEDNCSMVSLFVSDEYDGVNFNETILVDDTSDKNLVIYTAIVTKSLTGFQGAPVDFQMIVGENGENPASTTYWFFIELT